MMITYFWKFLLNSSPKVKRAMWKWRLAIIISGIPDD